MNISAENVHCSIANCHLEEVPEPKLCLERSTELVVDGIILAVRQHQLQKCAARGHHGSRNRVDSRSIDQVCTVINDVVKGRSTVTAGNNARDRKVSIAVKV